MLAARRRRRRLPDLADEELMFDRSDDRIQHSFGGDAAAYVLAALDPEEVPAFRRHLDDCAECRADVTALQRVVDALPMAAVRFPVPPALALGRRRPCARSSSRAPR